MLDGQAPKALAACRRALELQPGLEAALNNLALAHAVNGDFRSAEYIFALAGRRGRAQYNVGIVEMARRRYPEAVKAFEAAQALRPEFRAAGLMARAAREHVGTRSEP
jgi:Flp pilus assembly protein TadD